MSTLSERLDAYAALPPDERAEVDRAVAAAGSPDDATRLADARQLAALLDIAAGADPARPVRPDDVAGWLTDGALGFARPDDARVRAAVAADPALQAHAATFQTRLDELRAGAESPLKQFERLSGHRLSPADAVAGTPARDRVAGQRADDRPAASQQRMRLLSTRRLLVAATVVLVAYGGLAVASNQSATERARVADLSDLASYASPVTRGADSDPLAARLDAALDDVQDARRSTLGLFPRYDATALDAAAAELAEIAGETDAQSSVSQEARIALARVRLSAGRDDEAVRVLGALVRDGGYRAPEARRLLDFIRTQDGT